MTRVRMRRFHPATRGPTLKRRAAKRVRPFGGTLAAGGAARAACLVLAAGAAAALASPASHAQPARIAAGSAQDTAKAEASAPAAGAALELGSYLAGQHAFAKRDFDAAARYMSEALRVVPPPDPGLLRRALIARLASGQADAARALARRLLAIEKDAPLARLSMAVGDFKAARFDSAKERLSSILPRGPEPFYGPLLSAWAEVGSGDYDAAIAVLGKPDGNRNTAAFRSLHTALILDLAGRPEEAKREYLAAADEMREPAARFVQAVGSFFRRNGDAAEAERRFRAFLAERNRSSPIESELADLLAGKPAERIAADAIEGAAEAFFNAASLSMRARSTELGLIYGQFALDLKPDFPSARFLVGQIFESVGRDESAVKAYGQVDRASPLSWTARLQRAGGLSRLGREEEAIRILRRMATERQERTDALKTLGDLFRNKKRFPESVEAYDAAIDRIGTIETRHWRLLFSRGIALERSKNWPRAEKDLLAALELSPDEPYLLNYIGYSWVDQGIRLDDARRMIERAVELEPRSGAIVDSLGWALYRMGDFAGAVEKLERAAELEPLDPTVNDHLGDAYWRVGRRNEAAFQWRRALNLDPEPELVKIIEDKISRGLSTPQAGGGAR